MAAALTLMRARFPVAFDVNPSAGSSGMANLGTPDPKEIAIIGAGGGRWDFDFGVAIEADTFFGGFLSSQFDLAATIYSETGLGAGLVNRGAMSMGPLDARRRHAFLRLGAPVTSRYWGFQLTGTNPVFAGIFAIGKSIQPAWGHEWGSGRFIDDRSVKEPLPSGGWGVDARAIVPGWQFTCGDLTDVELAALWEIAQDVGLSRPVVVAEDPTAAQPALNLGLHYGTFDRPEAYERLLPGASRWAFRVTGWI